MYKNLIKIFLIAFLKNLMANMSNKATNLKKQFMQNENLWLILASMILLFFFLNDNQ